MLQLKQENKISEKIMKKSEYLQASELEIWSMHQIVCQHVLDKEIFLPLILFMIIMIKFFARCQIYI